MAILDILTFPNPVLRNTNKEVTVFDPSFATLVDDMFETMYAAPGVGLAAPQVGVNQQFFILDVSEDRTEPMVFANPKIIHQEGIEEMEEGCLSFPGVYANVKRAQSITCEAQDKEGKTFKVDAEELFAICIQHELDHLNGVLFIDHLSALKRNRLVKKLEKQLKRQS